MTAKHQEPDYIKIWGILFVLTIIEIGISKMRAPLGVHLMVMALLITAFWKATLVAMFYMHLKFEGRLLHFVSVFPLLLVAVLIFGLVPDVAMSQRKGTPAPAASAHGEVPAPETPAASAAK